MKGSKAIIDSGILPGLSVVILPHPLERRGAIRHELAYDIQPVSQWIAPFVPAGAAVAVAVDGVEVPEERLVTVVPKPGDEIVVCPYIGKRGGDLARMAAMLALVVATQGVFAKGALGVWAGAHVMSAAMLKGMIVLGGGLLINAALPPSVPASATASPSFTWTPGTLQQQGTPVPRIYGQVKTYGNVVAAWTEIANTTGSIGTPFQVIHGFPATYIAKSEQKLNTIIAYGEGPIAGVVADSHKLQGRAASSYSGVTVTERYGTDIQTKVLDGLKVELRPVLECDDDDSVVEYTTPDKHFDDLEIVIAFPDGLGYIDDMGQILPYKIGIKVEIKPVGGSYSTLVDEKVAAQTAAAIYQTYLASATYTGGSPVAIANGTQYVIKVTKDTTQQGGSYRDAVYLYAVREVLNDDFAYPGIAYTAVEAIASDKIAGSLQYEAVVQGRVVRVYDGGWTIEYSDNPAWIVWDVLTQPIITGDGAGTPYAVDSYQGVDPDDLILADFTAFAAFCDALVDDGRGGTEQRFTFAGIIDQQSNIYDTARQICAGCRAQLVNTGDKWRILIDQAGTPVQLFNVSNIAQSDFSMSAIEKADRASEIDIRYADADQDYRLSTVRARDAGLTDPTRKVSLDLIGCTRASQAWRVGAHLLRNNRYVKKIAQWTSDVEAIVCQVGDIVYLQHDALGETYVGGRVVSAQDNAIMLDKAVTDSGDDRVIVRSVSGGADIIQTKRVRGVSGSGVKVYGTWSPEPAFGDVYIYGPASLLTELYRVIAFESTADGRVRITGIQYADDAYPALETPEIPGEILVSAGGVDIYGASRSVPRSDIVDARPESVNAGRGYIYTPQVRGIEFSAAGGGKVAWTAGVIVYKGVGYQINADAVGTTDKWIWFDGADSDPFTLQHSNTYPGGADDWPMCRNDSGTPTPLYGTKNISDYAQDAVLADGTRDLTGDWTISTHNITLAAGTLTCKRLLAGS